MNSFPTEQRGNLPQVAQCQDSHAGSLARDPMVFIATPCWGEVLWTWFPLLTLPPTPALEDPMLLPCGVAGSGPNRFWHRVGDRCCTSERENFLLFGTHRTRVTLSQPCPFLSAGTVPPFRRCLPRLWQHRSVSPSASPGAALELLSPCLLQSLTCLSSRDTGECGPRAQGPVSPTCVSRSAPSTRQALTVVHFCSDSCAPAAVCL